MCEQMSRIVSDECTFSQTEHGSEVGKVSKVFRAERPQRHDPVTTTTTRTTAA